MASKIKLAFPDGNLKLVKTAITNALMEKAWEKLSPTLSKKEVFIQEVLTMIDEV